MFCATFQQSPLSKITLAGTYRDRHKERRYQVGILEQCSGGVGLTHNGKEYVEQALGFKGIDLCLYRRLAESEQARDAYADALSKKYRAAFDERPVAMYTGPSPMYRTDSIPQGFALLGKRHIDRQTNRMHGR